tara:strand:+ start:301 stop:588 length:288 start_codon:yes stop_codon:yes gene_type:complete
MKDCTKINKICGAKTRTGSPCAKFPIAGKRRCRLHGGLSTGPRTEEGKKKIADAQLKHGRYLNYRSQRKQEMYYFSQIKRVVAEAKAAGIWPEHG